LDKEDWTKDAGENEGGRQDIVERTGVIHGDEEDFTQTTRCVA